MQVQHLFYQNIPLVALAFLTGSIIYGIGLTLYRLTLHPLAKIPGRKLAAASQWYEFYHDVVRRPGGQYYFEVEKMHEEYGPIIRVAPNEVHIRDSEYHHVLYAPGSRRHKAPAMARMVGTPKSSFGTVDHDLHKLRRGPNGAMFSHKAIHGPAQTILCPEIDNLSNIFRSMQETNEVRDIRALFLGFASVFASQYFLGFRLNYLDDNAELMRWFEAVESLPKGTPILRQMPWIVEIAVKLPRWMPGLLSPHIAKTLSLHDLLRSKASDFLSSPEALTERSTMDKKTDLPRTIFHAIQRHNLPEEEKSIERLWQEAFTLYIGGLDTTSRTMAAATVYLLSNPTHLASLRRELDNLMLDPQAHIEYKTLEHLPFLNAVIQETLRCMQLVTGRIPVTCDEPMTYGDYHIPPGAIMSMTIPDVLTDPKIFANAEIWDPTRWLDAEGQLHHQLDEYFVAFGKGPRACVGQESARALMFRGLATTIRRFDFELYDFDYDRDFKMRSDFFYGDVSLEGRGWRVKVVGSRE